MSVGGPSSRGSSADASPHRSRLGFHGARIGVAVALAVLTYVLFPASPAVDLPVYEVGSVASDNVIAPFAFRVLKTPAELRPSATRSFARSSRCSTTFRPRSTARGKRSPRSTRRARRGGAADRRDQATGGDSARRGELGHAAHGDRRPHYLATERRRAALMLALSRVFDRWLSAGVASAAHLDSVHGRDHRPQRTRRSRASRPTASPRSRCS